MCSGRQEYLESLGTILHIEASFNHDRLRGIADDNWRVSEQGGTPLAMTATGIDLTGLADGEIIGWLERQERRRHDTRKSRQGFP